jgi:hypothetical protein
MIYGLPVAKVGGFPYGEWTTEPPEESGLYWFRASNWKSDDKPVTEQSYISVINGVVSFRPLIDGYEWEHEYEVKDVTHWLGPLPVPEPPK